MKEVLKNDNVPKFLTICPNRLVDINFIQKILNYASEYATCVK